VIKSYNELSHYSILFLSSNTIFINFCFSKNTLTLEYYILFLSKIDLFEGNGERVSYELIVEDPCLVN